MALLVLMMCEPGAHNLAKHVRRLLETSVRTKSMLVEASARTMAQLLPMVSEPACPAKRGMCHLAPQGPADADGMRDFRLQQPRHVPRPVEISGRTKAWLVPMVCEPACRSSARNVPRLVEASARSMVPVAANGVRTSFPAQPGRCRGLSRLPGGPCKSYCRWCARQVPVASSV